VKASPLCALGLLGAFISIPFPAGAQVLLLDQWPADPATTSGHVISDRFQVSYAAEDFVLPSETSIDRIEFLGVYFLSSPPNNPVSFAVDFRHDAAGVPGLVVATPTISAVAQTGVFSGSVSVTEFVLTFGPSVTLPAGTYWVDLRETFGGPTVVPFRWDFSDAFDAARGRAGYAVATSEGGPFSAVGSGSFALRIRGVLTPVALLDASVD
jgi:hypothetical protein